MIITLVEALPDRIRYKAVAENNASSDSGVIVNDAGGAPGQNLALDTFLGSDLRTIVTTPAASTPSARARLQGDGAGTDPHAHVELTEIAFSGVGPSIPSQWVVIVDTGSVLDPVNSDGFACVSIQVFSNTGVQGGAVYLDIVKAASLAAPVGNKNWEPRQEPLMKSQFQSTESLRVRLPPFINKTTGDYITGGSDVVTLTVERPDTTLLPGGPLHATYDAAVDLWIFTISTGSFMIGEWRVRAVSDDANAIPQWRVYYWGDYVDDITAAKTVSQSNGTAITAAQADLTMIKKVQLNRWKVQGTQLILYENDGTTIFKAFDLKDDAGLPSGTRIFERVPV